MAEAIFLSCLGKIGETFRLKVGDIHLRRRWKYLCCFHYNIKELETQYKMFQVTRAGVQLKVDNDLLNLRIIAPDVEAWLASANEVTCEAERIMEERFKMLEVKEGCLTGWCPNLIRRYSLSKKAVKKTEDLFQLKVVGYSYTQTSYSPAPASMVTMPNRDFIPFKSQRLKLEHIFEALKDDYINLIGICGMGGSGKTTIVKEVAHRAKEEYLFDEVAVVVVGPEPNPNYVQGCIAEMLGLVVLRDTQNPKVRADLLRRRLLQDNKNILVILDDIWAEMDLEDMGFPLGGPNKNFKMLYTSRTRYLWHELHSKKEIPLELLSKDEAWQLFREKVGDLADARDLQPIAKKIVDKCGRLPLALVYVGGALSKNGGRNASKEIWESMLHRLTCASNNPAVEVLYSHLQLSYKYLQDEEAQRLFLFCCLFEEDENIRIEDLARYGFGLSFFDRVNDMGKVRHQVLNTVDYLKSRYLLLDSEEKECVKVPDVMRNMGISIAAKVEGAIVSHGAASEWPKTVTLEHSIAISLISEKIKEVPEGLTYPNLEFLMLRCHELEKLSPNFFEGMGKLKVLELKNFHGILTFKPLKNLTTLSLEGFCGMLDNVCMIGDLLNLEILNFRDSGIKELPKDIKKLVNLRLLDLRGTCSLERILPGIVSRLVRLEELYVIPSRFCYWEGEGEEKGGNANLKEFESLSCLNTLEIMIKKHVVVPKLPILGELKKYKVIQEDLYDTFKSIMDNPYERQLMISEWNWDTPAGRGGIDILLRSSDYLILQKGSMQLLLPDGVDSLQQLKYLEIEDYDTPECLANTINPVEQPPNATAVFPVLEKLSLRGPHNLRELCRGPVLVGSFGQLTEVHIHGCERLGNLFQLPIDGCLAQLKSLSIRWCEMMEEVFTWKEQREDVCGVANNIIQFPMLETLELVGLPILVGFCRGIEGIHLPQLKEMRLQDLRKVNCLYHNNNNQSSNLEQNDNIVSFLSLFPEKVFLPKLEVLRMSKLGNLERLGHGSLPVESLSKLRDFVVSDCSKLVSVFSSQLVPMLQNLEELAVERCYLLEVVFEMEGVDSNDPKANRFGESSVDEVEFPQLKRLELCDLPNLRKFCDFTHPLKLPRLSEMDISFCYSMDTFSLGHVSAPNLSLSGISRNGDLINATQLLQEASAKRGGSSSLSPTKIVKMEKNSLPGALQLGTTKTRTLQVMVEENDDEGGDKDPTNLPVTESKSVEASRVEPLEDEVMEVLDSDEMGEESIKTESKEDVVEAESEDDFVRPWVAKAKENKESKLETKEDGIAGGEEPTEVKGCSTTEGVTAMGVPTAGAEGIQTASGCAVGDPICSYTGFEEMGSMMVGASSGSEGYLVKPSAKVWAVLAKTMVSVGDPKPRATIGLITGNASMPVVNDRLQEVVDEDEVIGSFLVAHPSQVHTTPSDYEEVDDDLYSEVHATPPREILVNVKHTPLSIDQQARHLPLLPSVIRGVVTEPVTLRNEDFDAFASTTQFSPLKQAFQTLTEGMGDFFEEPVLNLDGSRGSFGPQDPGELSSSHFQSEIQDEEDQGKDTLQDMPRSKVIAGVYVGVEHYPILEMIERRYPNVFSNLFPVTTWLTYGILTSFATFVEEVRNTRVDDLDASKIETFLVALKDFEQTGLNVSWIRPRFEEAQSINNLRMFAHDLEVSKNLVVERKHELAELEADVARREGELANAKRETPTSLVDGDFVLKGVF